MCSKMEKINIVYKAQNNLSKDDSWSFNKTIKGKPLSKKNCQWRGRPRSELSRCRPDRKWSFQNKGRKMPRKHSKRGRLYFSSIRQGKPPDMRSCRWRGRPRSELSRCRPGNSKNSLCIIYTLARILSNFLQSNRTPLDIIRHKCYYAERNQHLCRIIDSNWNCQRTKYTRYHSHSKCGQWG